MESVREEKFYSFCFHMVKIQIVNLFCFGFSFRSQRAKPVIIDPGLYLNKKSDVFWVTQRRSIPTAFKLFTGDLSFLKTYST